MMSKHDDLSQDPFASENLPERQSMAEDMRDVAFDKVKSSAGEYVRTAPKRMGRRIFWSIALLPSLANEYEKDRMLDRLEDGRNVGCYQMMFGETFSLFSILRMIIFFGVLGVVIYYLWSNGVIADIMEQQALIESLQATQTP